MLKMSCILMDSAKTGLGSGEGEGTQPEMMHVKIDLFLNPAAATGQMSTPENSP